MSNDVIALSPAGVAETIGVSLATAHRLIRTGELPSFTIGRSRRVLMEAVKAFIAERSAAARS